MNNFSLNIFSFNNSSEEINLNMPEEEESIINATSAANNKTHDIFIIESPLHKSALIIIQSLLSAGGLLNLGAMINYNNNRPIQRQNINDNLLLKNLCPVVFIEMFLYGIISILRIALGPLESIKPFCLLMLLFMRWNALVIQLTLIQWNVLKILFKSMTMRIGQINEDFFLNYFGIVNAYLAAIILAWFSIDGIKYQIVFEFFLGTIEETKDDGDFLDNVFLACTYFGIILNIIMCLIHKYIPNHIFHKIRYFLKSQFEEDSEDNNESRSKKLPPILKDPFIVDCSFPAVISYIVCLVVIVLIFLMGRNIMLARSFSEFPDTLLILLFININTILRGYVIPIHSVQPLIRF